MSELQSIVRGKDFADATFGQLHFPISDNKYLHFLVVERENALNLDAKMVQIALRTEKAAAIGTPLTKGTIFWDVIRRSVVSSGSTLNQTRKEYRLLNYRVDNRKKGLWLDVKLTVGAATELKATIYYSDKPLIIRG